MIHLGWLINSPLVNHPHPFLDFFPGVDMSVKLTEFKNQKGYLNNGDDITMSDEVSINKLIKDNEVGIIKYTPVELYELLMRYSITSMPGIKLRNIIPRSHNEAIREYYYQTNNYINSLNSELTNVIDKLKFNIGNEVSNLIKASLIEVLLDEIITNISIEIIEDEIMVRLAMSKKGKL